MYSSSTTDKNKRDNNLQTEINNLQKWDIQIIYEITKIKNKITIITIQILKYTKNRVDNRHYTNNFLVSAISILSFIAGSFL